MEVVDICVFDKDGEIILAMSSEGIKIEESNGFIDVSHGSPSGRIRHTVIPSTNISKIIFYE